MSAFAPPVQRDHFIYQDALYIDVGNANRHKRATVAELTTLLRPAKNTIPRNDEVGHYYEAQLVHYGLARSKNKAVAKVRLLEALNKDSLRVPDSVADVEQALKKEWEAENRKAKKAFKEGKQTPDAVKEVKSSGKQGLPKAKPTPATKRPATDEDDTKPAKKVKTETKPPKNREPTEKGATNDGTKPVVKAKSETKPLKKSDPKEKGITSSSQPPTNKPKVIPGPRVKTTNRGGASTSTSTRGGRQSTAARAEPTHPPASETLGTSPSRTQSSQLSTRGYRTKQTARRGTFSGAHQRPSASFRQNIVNHNSSSRGHDFEDPPPPYILEDYDDDDRSNNHYDEDENLDYESLDYDEDEPADVNHEQDRLFDNFSGLYQIGCPTIAASYPNSIPANGLNLKLIYKPSSGIYWGSSDLGEFDGVLASTSPEERDQGTGMYARFEWRGREPNPRGFVIRQPRGRSGYVKITHDGKIRGAFSSFEGQQFDFLGQKIAEATVVAGGTAEQIKREFESFSVEGDGY